MCRAKYYGLGVHRVAVPAKSAFYETVTGVSICFGFFLSLFFVLVCDACCSPPGSYSHTGEFFGTLGAGWGPVGESMLPVGERRVRI